MAVVNYRSDLILVNSPISVSSYISVELPAGRSPLPTTRSAADIKVRLVVITSADS